MFQKSGASHSLLVAVGGLSGTGKSTLSEALAPRLGAAVLRSDVVRKRLAGLPPAMPLSDDAYTPQARAATYKALLAEIRAALRTGAVIADAVWAAPEHRAALESLAAGAGVPFIGLWLVAPLETTLRRVAARAGDASDATEDTLRAQTAADPACPAGWHLIPAAGDPATALHAALAALGQPPS